AVIPSHGVVTRLLRRFVERDQELWLPGNGINAKKAAEPQCRNPKFAIVPHPSMAAATIVRRPERNLAMAHLLGIHGHLKDAFWRGIRAHPDVAATHCHATGIP